MTLRRTMGSWPRTETRTQIHTHKYSPEGWVQLSWPYQLRYPSYASHSPPSSTSSHSRPPSPNHTPSRSRSPLTSLSHSLPLSLDLRRSRSPSPSTLPLTLPLALPLPLPLALRLPLLRSPSSSLSPSPSPSPSLSPFHSRSRSCSLPCSRPRSHSPTPIHSPFHSPSPSRSPSIPLIIDPLPIPIEIWRCGSPTRCFPLLTATFNLVTIDINASDVQVLSSKVNTKLFGFDLTTSVQECYCVSDATRSITELALVMLVAQFLETDFCYFRPVRRGACQFGPLVVFCTLKRPSPRTSGTLHVFLVFQ